MAPLATAWAAVLPPLPVVQKLAALQRCGCRISPLLPLYKVESVHVFLLLILSNVASEIWCSVS
jgi:hypothetical protein